MTQQAAKDFAPLPGFIGRGAMRSPKADQLWRGLPYQVVLSSQLDEQLFVVTLLTEDLVFRR